MADVVIVGGSIAGAVTAIHLARLGYAVQVLEAAQFPRRKACGEGLSPQGVAELDSLGLLPALLPQAALLTSLQFEIAGASVEAPLGSPGQPAMGIERGLLDAALLELAGREGVQVCHGVRASGLVAGAAGFDAVETDRGRVLAKVIVAADGAGSRLRGAAGLDAAGRRARYGMSAHYRWPGPAGQRIEVHFRDGHEVYVTPVGEARVNVAVLMGREQARRLSGRLVEGYDALVAASGVLPAGAIRDEQPSMAGPFPSAAKRLYRDNLVLVGDAAGFFDGLTGEGMSQALIGARSCAQAIHRFLRSGDAGAYVSYERRQRSRSRNSALLARFALLLARQQAVGRWATMNLSKHPSTFAKLVAINQGERELASLTPRDLLAMTLGL